MATDWRAKVGANAAQKEDEGQTNSSPTPKRVSRTDCAGTTMVDPCRFQQRGLRSTFACAGRWKTPAKTVKKLMFKVDHPLHQILLCWTTPSGTLHSGHLPHMPANGCRRTCGRHPPGSGQLAAATLLLVIVVDLPAAAAFCAPSVGLRGALREGIACARSVPCSRASELLHMRAEEEDTAEVTSQVRRRLLKDSLYFAALAAASSQPRRVSACSPAEKAGIVLVVGATSTMGQDTCKDLLALGYKVRGLTRRSEDVQKAVEGTELAQVEWVKGNLNNLADLAPAMKGVKRVIFAPLLATRAGLDPAYVRATVFEDVEMNRRIYADAVAEILRLGRVEGLDKFVLVSSVFGASKSSLDAELEASEDAASAAAAAAPEGVPLRLRNWKRVRVEPSLLNPEVIRFKLSGEEQLKMSGVPYTIVRAYSPPPRPWSDPREKDFSLAVFQRDDAGVSGVISRSDLGHLAAEAVVNSQTDFTTFQAMNIKTGLSQEQAAIVRRANPRFPDWKGSLTSLAKDRGH